MDARDLAALTSLAARAVAQRCPKGSDQEKQATVTAFFAEIGLDTLKIGTELYRGRRLIAAGKRLDGLARAEGFP